MNVPTPDPTAYAKLILVSLGTLAVLQYVGLFRDRGGEVDVVFLVGVGLVMPIMIYAISVAGTNSDLVPDWDEMTQ